MERFMVVVKTDEGTEAWFFDDAEKADQARMDAEVSLGWYCEVYERQETEFGREYVFAWN